MEPISTRNSALPIARAFHYQMLVGLLMCFDLNENESIFFEYDGDVSLLHSEDDIRNNQQIEVKKYEDKLTDQHQNFWKTLSNWLAPEFKQERYSKLVLFTTQKIGRNSQFKNWDNIGANERLAILLKICAETSEDSPIRKYQEKIIKVSETVLKEVLVKVNIIEEAPDTLEIMTLLKNKLVGIPDVNKESYISSLVGYVYQCQTSTFWTISQKAFKELTEFLTKKFSAKFVLPAISGGQVSKQTADKYNDQLFVQKLCEIEMSKHVPKAVSCWLEVLKIAEEKIHESPLYREFTDAYMRKLESDFILRFERAQIKCDQKDWLKHSKIFCLETLSQEALKSELFDYIDIDYKNGLLHVSMNDCKKQLKWSLKES